MSRIALVFRPRGSGDDTRFAAVAAALVAEGFGPECCPYDEAREAETLSRLRGCAAALVWVNPVQDGRRRAGLDALLREAAQAGVLVSAHPDVIDRLGVKAVLWSSRALGWSGDARFYGAAEDLMRWAPQTIGQGPRVLKPNRGNNGDGVWKVAACGPGEVLAQEASAAEVRRMPLGAFLAERAAELDAVQGFVDQAFQTRVGEGMVRAYLSGAKVAGFGAQAGVALAERAVTPRLYSGPDDPRFQDLRARLETDWAPRLAGALGLSADDLPLIWDADFLRGEGPDGWVLCEINCSSVYPMPEEAPALIASTLRSRLAARAQGPARPAPAGLG